MMKPKAIPPKLLKNYMKEEASKIKKKPSRAPNGDKKK
jgi:hypothetical protein